MGWSWDFMLHVFRGLGGTADNIARGPRGRSIVPVDPARPVAIHVPQNLLVTESDLEFANGRLRVSQNAKLGNGERTFLENYFDTFSWGGGGQEEAVAFIAAIDSLPEDIRKALSEVFYAGPILEHGDRRAEHWFLRSRRIELDSGNVIAPILDLVTHNPSSRPFLVEDGVALAGTFEVEVSALRGRVDPLGAFFRFGFASPERVAASLPLALETEGGRIEIGPSVRFGPKIGSFRIPIYERDGDVLKISGLMIGNDRFPRLPRGAFDHIMREAGKTDSGEIFDLIQHRNRIAFLRFLGTLEAHEGGLIPELRKVVRHQLEAMSYSIGTREL